MHDVHAGRAGPLRDSHPPLGMGRALSRKAFGDEPSPGLIATRHKCCNNGQHVDFGLNCICNCIPDKTRRKTSQRLWRRTVAVTITLLA